MITPEELAEIKKRCEAATEGPWLPYHGPGAHWVTDSKPDGTHKFQNRICEYTYRYGEDQNHKDVDFIAHSRTDIPKLLTELDRLNALVEKAEIIMKRNSMFPGDIEQWEKAKVGK